MYEKSNRTCQNIPNPFKLKQRQLIDLIVVLLSAEYTILYACEETFQKFKKFPLFLNLIRFCLNLSQVC